MGPVIQKKNSFVLKLGEEKKLEELGWIFLFPDGKSNFKEYRYIYITPLDYSQVHVMSNDKRFQRTLSVLYFVCRIFPYKIQHFNVIQCYAKRNIFRKN